LSRGWRSNELGILVYKVGVLGRLSLPASVPKCAVLRTRTRENSAQCRSRITSFLLLWYLSNGIGKDRFQDMVCYPPSLGLSGDFKLIVPTHSLTLRLVSFPRPPVSDCPFLLFLSRDPRSSLTRSFCVASLQCGSVATICID
jgi:hypothetical protein